MSYIPTIHKINADKEILLEVMDANKTQIAMMGVVAVGIAGALIFVIARPKQANSTIISSINTTTKTVNTIKEAVTNVAKPAPAKPAPAPAPSNMMQKVNQILKESAKFKYERGTGKTTAAALEKYGRGDCWAHSDWLFQKMKAAGIPVRKINYATSASRNHRTVQVLQNGKWIDPIYSAAGISKMFRPITSKPSMKVLAVANI